MELKPIEVAKKRIDALESLLVCYRISNRPTDELFDQLERSKKQWEEVWNRRQADESDT